MRARRRPAIMRRRFMRAPCGGYCHSVYHACRYRNTPSWRRHGRRDGQWLRYGSTIEQCHIRTINSTETSTPFSYTLFLSYRLTHTLYTEDITLAQRIEDSGPLSQRSAHAAAEQYAQTKTNTNHSPDPNRYRRRCPGPNARIEKFIHYMAIAAICDSGLSPYWRYRARTKYTDILGSYPSCHKWIQRHQNAQVTVAMK